jgi:hypothetical protein
VVKEVGGGWVVMMSMEGVQLGGLDITLAGFFANNKAWGLYVGIKAGDEAMNTVGGAG